MCPVSDIKSRMGEYNFNTKMGSVKGASPALLYLLLVYHRYQVLFSQLGSLLP